MAELLLELFSEEIPARFQPRAEEDLARLLALILRKAGTGFKAIHTFCTPRRLTAQVAGLPKTLPDINEERRGPRVGAPERAIAGFARSTGVKPSDLIVKDGYYFAKIERKGAATADVLAKSLPEMIAKFPWPKSMRWGKGRLKWVRPLHSILCVLDGKVVEFEVDGVKSVNRTRGHRFLAPKPFAVRDFKDYQSKLRKAYVVLSADEREQIILGEARKLARSKGLTYVYDEALLGEVAGMTEWPVALLGAFDRSYLEVPEEVLVAAMQHHLKFFPLRKGNKLAPHFISIANTAAANGGKQIIAGNERVLAARLSDARFFWRQDVGVPLEQLSGKLSGIVFHEKLGTVADRVRRVEQLVGKIGDLVPECDPKKALRAAHLAKADLASQMVGEFPELQGIMGGYYAKEQGEDEKVWAAIRVHYLPQGPSDRLPKNPESIALALADKIELLQSMWGIGEKPTGSKDPFALRRAALGAIRIIVENRLRIRLQKDLGLSDELLEFFEDRLKVQTREKGVRHDLIDAVFSLGHEDDLVRILNRVSALQEFLKTKDGENLLIGHKRAVNILKEDENKNRNIYIQDIDVKLLKEKEEIALYTELKNVRKAIGQALMEEDFKEVMTEVSKLRKPIDNLFDNVRVNVEDDRVRENRLRLLAGIRLALMPVADFSKIEG